MLAVCCASLGHYAHARALAAQLGDLEDFPEAERDLLEAALERATQD